jgi:hypothetical protein
VLARLVDQCHRGHGRRSGRFAHKALEMGGVRCLEDNGALGLHQFGPAVMDIGGGVERDPGVEPILLGWGGVGNVSVPSFS